MFLRRFPACRSRKASGRSKLTREPRQINAQLGRQTGAELSALFVKRCLIPPSGLCRPVWISRMTKPAEDRVAGEFNPAGRLRAEGFTARGSEIVPTTIEARPVRRD